MKQEFFNLKISTTGQRLYEFTDHTIQWINNNKFKNGILNLSIQHTSASLIVLFCGSKRCSNKYNPCQVPSNNSVSLILREI